MFVSLRFNFYETEDYRYKCFEKTKDEKITQLIH